MKRLGCFVVSLGVVVAALFVAVLVGVLVRHHWQDTDGDKTDVDQSRSLHEVDRKDSLEDPMFATKGYAFTNRAISMTSFPSVVNLENHLLAGQSMRFDVKTSNSSKMFSISFSDKNNTKTHLLLTFLTDVNRIYLDSFENGESIQNRSVILDYAVNTEEPETITVHVRFMVGRFEVFVNFAKITEYKFLLPVNTVESVELKDGVESCDITYGGRLYPKDYRELFGELKEGHVIITGQASTNFSISFYDADLNRFFYMNTRFHQNTTVHNSHIEGVWGAEERHDDFPFVENELFELRLTVGNESVEVDHNRKKHFHFNHRTKHPLKDYVGIEIFEMDNLWNVEWY